MFDVGFWELTVIAVVALIVIGPERLPKVARTAGLWVGRMRGFVMSVKADIDKELRAEELKKIIEEQTKSSGLHEIIEETQEGLEDLNKPADYLVKAEKPADDETKPSDKPVEDRPEPSDKPADETKQDHGGQP